MTRRELVAFLPAASLLRCTSLRNPSTPVVTAPDFSLKNAAGATIRLSEYKSKVVLLNFWATWCGGCKKEIPWFVEFQNAYKDRGFAVLGASFDAEGWEIVRPFLDTQGVNYPVVLGNGELSAQYDVSALPKTLLIDREGKIVISHVGMVDKTEFKKQIQELLR